MKLYLYNCNNQNQYIGEVETETPQDWAGCSTEQPYRQSDMYGASYAFNTQINDWVDLICDWRGIRVYNKNNSLINEQGGVGPLKNNYVPQAPPDPFNKYIWNEQEHNWVLYVGIVDPVAIIKGYEDAIQEHIDKVAQDRGYDNGYTCASYYLDKNPKFASDAKVFKDWRSDVWVIVNNILNQYTSQLSEMDEVTQNDLSQFPGVFQIIINLPKIEWIDVEVTQGE